MIHSKRPLYNKLDMLIAPEANFYELFSLIFLLAISVLINLVMTFEKTSMKMFLGEGIGKSHLLIET